MTQISNLKLAQQGDPAAIAALMSRSLNTQNITSAVHLENGRLQIILESDPVPNQSVMVEFVRRGLSKLKPASIQTVEVQGKQTNQRRSKWVEAFPLSNSPESVSSIPQADSTQLGEFPPLRRSQLSPLLKTQIPLIAGTILFSVAILWGCWSTLMGSDQKTLPTAPISRGNENLKITEMSWKTEDRSRYLIGTVYNSSNQRYPYVQVEFDLYSPVGTQIGSSLVGIEELGPNQSKQFKAIVFENHATKAAVKGVYGLR
jgi:hypothetical protein